MKNPSAFFCTVRSAILNARSVVVPLSPLRIGFDSELVHRQNGLGLVATPDFEATLLLPNLEQRFKVFVTGADPQETPGDPTEERNPLRLGARFTSRSHISFEFGVQAKSSPSAFGAVKWSPEFDAGALRMYPFIKTYVQSGLGVSGDRASHTSLYETSVLMKRPLHGGWLFGYVEPVVQWNRNFRWYPDFGARVGFDALFWGLASLPTEVATYCR